MDGDQKGQGAANDNECPAGSGGGGVEETRRATGEDLDRVVVDIARMIGRQMARADHAARVEANDNDNSRAGREPEAD